MNKRVVILFLFVLLGVIAKGQATFTGPISISDLDTTIVNVQVQNLANVNLSSQTQGVCAVKVDMRHDFVGDLKVTLISPSGQKVQLMGPAVAQAPGTQFVQWKVQFNASSFPVFPDGTFDDVWNNLNSWTGLGTAFVGTYYPYDGGLEDINLGSAVGIWQMEFIDQSENGEGIINSFEIIFCDPADIEYTQCDPGEHDINIQTPVICQYSEDINSLITNMYINETVDSTLYNYDYAVFSTDGLVNISSLEELSQFVGNFTLCGISYLNSELIEIANIPTGLSPIEFQNYVEDNNLCLSLSNNCQQISLIEAPELTSETVLICDGDQVVINGTVYDESGEYEIYTPRPACDSLSILILEVVEDNFMLDFSIDMLTCTEPVSVLSVSNIDADVTIEWTTVDGLIFGDPSSQSIEAIKPGTYSYIVSKGDCEFTGSVLINSSPDYVFAIMTADTIDCNNPIAIVNLVTEAEIDSVKWISAQPFVELSDGIQTKEPGIYAVEFFATNGCNSFRGIEVVLDSATIDIVITGGNLGCDTDSTLIYGSPQMPGEYEYQWYDGTTKLGTDSMQVVYNPSEYFLYTTGSNGCIDTSSIIVSEDVDLLEVSLINDTITCSDSLANLSFMADVDPASLEILWTTSTSMTANTVNFSTKETDTIMLSLISDSGCRFDTAFVIVTDTLASEVSLLDTEFNCLDDSIQLVLIGLEVTDMVSWSGPFFTSTEISPYITETGEYIYTITSENDCTLQETILVSSDANLPQMDFDFGQLTCEFDTIEIVPSSTVGFSFEWTDPQDNVSALDTLIVTEPGIYHVRYTDVTSGCFSQKSIQVFEDVNNSLESVTIGNIDCDISVVTPEIIDSTTIRSSRWFDIDNSVEYSTELTPQFSVPGRYSLEYVLENGCSGADTVQIEKLDTPIDLSLFTDTIKCNNLSVEIMSEVDGVLSELLWIYPDSSTANGETISTDQGGLHTAIARSTGNCIDTVFIEVPIDTLKPEVTLSTDGNLQCVDNEVIVNLITTGIVDVSWSGPSIVSETAESITVDEPGLYEVLVTDHNECVGEDEIMVQSDKVDPSYFIDVETLDCSNASSMGTIVPENSNYTIEWEASNLSGFENSFTEAGAYYFTIFTEDNCEMFDSVVIVIDTLNPSPEFTISNTITCLDLTTDLFVTSIDSNAIYVWSGPGIADETEAPLINIAGGGMYTLKTTYTNGCDNTLEIEVTEDNSSPEITIEADTISCSSGKAYIDVQSEETLVYYKWSGPDDYESESDRPLVSEAGLYTVTVTGENGCLSMANVEVIDEQVFPIVEVDTAYLRCDESAVVIVPTVLSDGATLSWIGPGDIFVTNQTLETTQEGEYFVVAQNEIGCISSDTFQVLDIPILPEFDFLSDSLYCNMAVRLVSVNTEDDETVTWTHPDGSRQTALEISTNEPGDFILTVLGINGCKDSVVVNVPDGRYFPSFNIEQLSALECDKDNVDLLADGFDTNRLLSYHWTSANGVVDPNNTNVQVQVTGAGTYILEVTDLKSTCTSVDSFDLIRIDQTFTDLDFEIYPPSCQDFADAIIEIVEFNGDFPPYNIMLDDVNYGEQFTIKFLEPGSYTMIVTDSIGCQVEKQIIIAEGEYPFVDLPNDTIIQLGDSVLINPVITPDVSSLSIEWNIAPPCDPCTSFYLVPEDTYLLEITVSDTSGCSFTDEMIISISEIELKKYPNIFSPNGDDNNDVFYMPYTKGVQNIESLKIFDWNGVKMFEKVNVLPGNESDGWDGTVNGQPALTGVYLYEAVIKLIDDSFVTVVGDLTLIR